MAIWVVMVATAVRADQADDQFAVAAGNYDRQQWKPAVDEFQTFLKNYPNDRRANQSRFFLGEALVQLGKLDAAGQQFHQYLTHEPDGKYARVALFRAGESAYLAGNLAAAKPELESFVAKYGDDRLNAFVLPYLGDITLSAGNAAAASELFRDGLKRFPEGRMQDDCRFGLARALEKQKQLDEAERLYLAVASKPGSSLADAAQFHLGALQYAASRYDSAAESFSVFDDRLKASSWRPHATLARGLALLKLHRAPDAVKQFDAVVATPSISAELLQNAIRGRIQAALDTKDYAAADREAADFEKRFAEAAIIGDVRRMLARSLVERKEFARAAALLEPLVKSAVEPLAEGSAQENIENRYLLAVTYEGLQRYPEALAAVLPVVDVATGPLKVDAQLTYGSLLVASKKYADAISPLEAVLETKPSGELAAKAAGELAVCYARTGQLGKAKKVYAELIAKNPQHALVAPTTSAPGRCRLRCQRRGMVGRVVGPLGCRWDFRRVRVEGQAGARLDPVQGRQAARGRRHVRRGPREEPARGDGGRGGLDTRPDSRNPGPERARLGDVRSGDPEVFCQQAARRCPAIRGPSPQHTKAESRGGCALRTRGQRLSAVPEARRRALRMGVGDAGVGQAGRCESVVRAVAQGVSAEPLLGRCHMPNGSARF